MQRQHATRLASAAMAALLLAGCGSAPPVVPGPLYVPPAPPPLYVERPVNGAIFQPHMTQSTLFSSDRRPQAIGDTLKVDIAESLQASQKSSTDTGRDNKVSVKGPGKSEKSGGLFESLMNANASASSNDSFKGSGTTEASSGFNAHLAVTVINVLPNGHLLVAGERKMGLNGGVSVLRFSGVVDPHDIRPGNIVNSRDVANASLESGGSGDVSDAASRSWLQRVLSRSMAIW